MRTDIATGLTEQKFVFISFPPEDGNIDHFLKNVIFTKITRMINEVQINSFQHFLLS
jgi:hypothetical protein